MGPCRNFLVGPSNLRPPPNLHFLLPVLLPGFQLKRDAKAADEVLSELTVGLTLGLTRGVTGSVAGS